MNIQLHMNKDREDLLDPVYYPSVSSVKTALRPLEYIKIMLAASEVYPYFLVSAYDIANIPDEHDEIFKEHIDSAASKGISILLDSGNYESYWKTSSWSQKDFHSILNKTSCKMAFCYDIQSPPVDIELHKRIMLTNWCKDKKYSNGKIVIPIIHGIKDYIPSLCKYIAKETKSPVVAVPERRLGDSLIERAKMVAEIRLALNENGEFTKLHLLGTGNPISIVVYSIMGANSFDGLEWCQTVVDPETGVLFHFSQADMFLHKGSYGHEDLPFVLKTLIHNLEFYSGWMSDLQAAIRLDTAIDFCENRFLPEIYSYVSKRLGWRKPA